MKATRLSVLPVVTAALIAMAGTASAAPATGHAQAHQTTITPASPTYCIWTVDPNIDFLRVHTRPNINSWAPYQIPGGTHVTATLDLYSGPGGPFRYGDSSGNPYGYMAARYLVNRGVCFN
ncbi:MAG TPA: hypothetical protein VLJ59_07305 [Mycobacteriales bacterium]|nr:hypothetical protein [Mycobacteriales bacterium]